jgi:signal transduction histidine kinase
VVLPDQTVPLEAYYAYLAELTGWIFHELGRNWIGRAVPRGAKNFKAEFVKAGSKLTMTVSDDGPGFDFSQLRYGESTFIGLGVGLGTICEFFRQTHLGELTVISQG